MNVSELASAIESAWESRSPLVLIRRGRQARATGQADSRPARRRRTSGCRKNCRGLAGASMGQEGGVTVLSAQSDGRDLRRRGRRQLVGQGAEQIQRLGRGRIHPRRLSRGARLPGAARSLYCAWRCVAPQLCQYRSLCRARHDGRWLVYDRLLRAGRRKLPHQRRGRDWRRAGAGTGGPGDHRG